MTRSAFLAVAAALVASALPLAARPNFSGTWTMVAAKSDFGRMPAPTKYEQKIEHNDPNLKVTISQAGQHGDRSNDFVYHTGGKQTTNDAIGGSMKSKAKWEGDVLVINSTMTIQGNDVPVVDRYSLGADGMLTMTHKLSTPSGDFETKVVMSKQ